MDWILIILLIIIVSGAAFFLADWLNRRRVNELAAKKLSQLIDLTSSYNEVVDEDTFKKLNEETLEVLKDIRANIVQSVQLTSKAVQEMKQRDDKYTTANKLLYDGLMEWKTQQERFIDKIEEVCETLKNGR